MSDPPKSPLPSRSLAVSRGSVDKEATARALRLACRDGNVHEVNLLLSRAGVEATSLLDTADEGGLTALHYAALNMDAKCVEVLIGGGADVNARSAYGSSVLHWAVLDEKGGNCVKALLAAKANVEVVSDYGLTPLGWALYWGNKRCAMLLLEAGAQATKCGSKDVPDWVREFKPKQ
jgi:Ankyrin repeats (3 copies)